MKAFLLLLIVVMNSTVDAFATVITVDNNSNSAAQYTGISAAIAAASPGDTIYVSGSNNSYGNITINQQVVLLGAGYNPLKQQPLVSIVAAINLDTVTAVSGASGSVIAGFQSSTFTDNYGAKNVTIERNYFFSSINLQAASSGFQFRNNLTINNVNVNNATNLFIENNIFYGAAISTSNQATVLISHNLFMGVGTYCLSLVSQAMLVNNIFWTASPVNSSIISCTFNNNLTYQTINDTIPGAGNFGSNNIVSTNPQFVNAPSAVINLGYDYNVMNGSPADNAGTDGTDLGIFGGTTPMQNLSGMPAIPQMILMNINTPIIPPGGNLDINFKAKKNN